MQAPPPTRRRFALRFGLRSILLVMVVVSVLLAWKFNEVRAQRRVVAALDELGAFWLYDYASLAIEDAVRKQQPIGPANIGTPPGPVWLNELLGEDLFARVDLVDLFVESHTDEIVAQVASLPALRDLKLYQATDEQLALLAGARMLENLDLEGTFTDAAVEGIARLPKLKSLSLHSVNLTDATLVSLARRKTLKVLLVEGKAFSEEQEDQLRAMLPHCEIRISRDWQPKWP